MTMMMHSQSSTRPLTLAWTSPQMNLAMYTPQSLCRRGFQPARNQVQVGQRDTVDAGSLELSLESRVGRA
jgi:hypothetical protein